MFVPVPASSPGRPEAAPDEPRDMAVALRLLSGKDCERDARTAHTMLVRLSESRTASVREEAARVLKAGVANDWFGERAPKHYELERIAEKTLALRHSDTDRRRVAVMLGAGLAALFGGLVAFMASTDSPNFDVAGQAVIAVFILILLVAMVLFKVSTRGRS